MLTHLKAFNPASSILDKCLSKEPIKRSPNIVTAQLVMSRAPLSGRKLLFQLLSPEWRPGPFPAAPLCTLFHSLTDSLRSQPNQPACHPASCQRSRPTSCVAETICLALKNLVLASPRPPATFSYSGTSLLDEGQGESGLDVVLQANLGGSAAFGLLFASIVHSDQHIHIVNLHQPQLRTVLAREPQGHKPGHELHILVLEPQTFGKYTVSLWMVGSYKTTARNCEHVASPVVLPFNRCRVFTFDI